MKVGQAGLRPKCRFDSHQNQKEADLIGRETKKVHNLLLNGLKDEDLALLRHFEGYLHV